MSKLTLTVPTSILDKEQNLQLQNMRPAVEKLEIQNEATLKTASGYGQQIAVRKKEFKVKYDSYVSGAKEYIKQVDAIYKPVEKELLECDRIVRDKISEYQTEQVRLARLEEQRLAARVEKGTMKLETAIRKVEQIEKPENKVDLGEAHAMHFREDRIPRIVNEADIPREYLVPDMSKIKVAIKQLNLVEEKSGIFTTREIPGIVVSIVRTPVFK